MRVFIAGPLFNPKEREENLEIDSVLKSVGHETFLPQRDGFLLQDIIKELKNSGLSEDESQKIAMKTIFLLDTYNSAKNCDALVLNLNGRVPDEGGLIEASLAFSNGKKLVFYKSDSRSLIMGNDNPMVDGIVDFKIIHKIEEIPIALNSSINNFEEVKKKAELIFKEYEKNKTIKNLVELAKKFL